MRTFERRSLGLLVPLFCLRSGEGWGTGEYPDLARLARWARTGGASFVLTLPLLEPSPGQESPYAACSFRALDPLYIALRDVPEHVELGGVASLDPRERLTLDAIEEAPRVDHSGVRWLKLRALERAFDQLMAKPASHPRRLALAAFEREHAGWLEPYALFRAVKAQHPESCREWPGGLAEAEPSALARFTEAHPRELALLRYLQWIAFTQLAEAREEMHRAGVALFGDEPFLVADDSADVWSRRELFRFDATVGAPPDAFSADGQEWGLPPYRWDALRERGYDLFRERGAHAARLYDGVRLDHIVGLYRTYHRPRDGSPHFFYPAEPGAQRAQGEAVLEAFRASGLELLAEDLGVIPPFVRESLERLQIPGYRVLRWEKDGPRFRDPAAWSALSVATTGTHDTESSIDWWEQLSREEREQARAWPRLRALFPEGAPPIEGEAARAPDERARFTEALWRALLSTLLESASCAALVPIHDLLALRDRVNTPNTVGPLNWSVRLPWTLEVLERDPIVRGRMRFVEELARATGRAPGAARDGAHGGTEP